MAALAFAACYTGGRPEDRVPVGSAATGGSAGRAPNDASFETSALASGTLRIVHALRGAGDAEWALGDAGESGSIAFGSATDAVELSPGKHELQIAVNGSAITPAELDVKPGATLFALLASDGDGNATVRILPDPSEEASDSPSLYLVNASESGSLAIDVGMDDPAEPDLVLEQDRTVDAPLAFDATRPALAFVQDGMVGTSFGFPRPDAGSPVLVVALGDASLDGVAPDALRLLVVETNGATEVRADPVLYIVHASDSHAGLDVFVGRGNPVLQTKNQTTGYAPDLSEDKPRRLAEIVDDLHFGKLAIGRVPPGPATLDVYLTITGSAQAPSPVNFDLVGTLLPNQRLRDGWAVGRQGGQVDETTELRPGGEYLMLLSGNRLFTNHRNPQYVPVAPIVPMERLDRPPLDAGQLDLRVAFALSDSAAQGGTAVFQVDGHDVLTTPPKDWAESASQSLPAGPHTVRVKLSGGFSRSLSFQGGAGQHLLVIAAGNPVLPPMPVVASSRADDTDNDSFVNAPLDPQTGQPSDPNYLPSDGNTQLNQDDCPNVPGPTFGCPAVAFQWLVLDTSVRPPALTSLTPAAE